MREVEVAEKLVAWLGTKGLAAYQEVVLPTTGIADVVCNTPNGLWIIEVKTRLSFELLYQAKARLRFARYVSVAVPSSQKTRARRYAIDIVRKEGIGYIEVGARSVREIASAPLNETADERKLAASLNTAQLDYLPAGSRGGGHWTPFKQTCEDLLRVVNENPGLTIPEALGLIDHHYKSTRSGSAAIKKYILKGVIKTVSLNHEGRLYLGKVD